jgi:hypothetical protein
LQLHPSLPDHKHSALQRQARHDRRYKPERSVDVDQADIEAGGANADAAPKRAITPPRSISPISDRAPRTA